MAVLELCARHARRAGLPPPAAFVGDWLSSAAVIAPSVALEPVAPADVFATGPRRPDVSVDDLPRPDSGDVLPHADSGWRIGFRGFPDVPRGGRRLLPEAVSGRADGLLVLGHDGRWSTRGIVPGPDELGVGAGPPSDDEDDHDDRDDHDDHVVPHPRWSAPDRDAHRAAVLECLEAIRAGEIYQACLSTRLDGVLDHDPLHLFTTLWSRTRARRAAYLAGSWGAVVSLSPETYLTRRGREVGSSPIKGTVAGSADPATLRESVKDVAENIMIVDLVRHDLGRTAELGTVRVPELLTLREAPGVWHLVSRVTARTGVDHPELVETTFPPASVTGTPKLRARELISDWESRARGLHCGTIGIADADRLDLNVAIRTLEVAPDGRCEFGVGGGITIDSDPDAEWLECLHKAAFTWGGGPAPWLPPPDSLEELSR